MSQNPDAVSNQGEFHARVPPSKPLTTSGHAPGTKIGNDAVPEFHAETLPAGTAPSESTFEPNPTSDVPGQANNPDATERTNAQDTIVGATSQDVHTGLGLPIQGQSSQQLHGSGLTKGTKEGSGLTGLAGGALTN